LGLSGFHAGLFTAEQTAALGGIALAKYGLPGTKKLKSNVVAALATGAHVVLMAQHGALIVGADRNEAFSRAILLETLCKSACKGQAEEDLRGDEAKAATLKEFVSGAFGHVAVSTAPAVLRTANSASMFRAQLDDMAQIIGPKMFCVDPAPDTVLKALRRRDAVLVKGVGALCRADTRGDCEALPLLVEKACVGYLHTRALNVNVALSSFDALLMRTVYQMKYAKKAGSEYGKAAT
jgi:L-fuculose-phosphate aldolase